MTTHLLNSAVMPQPGTYILREISTGEFVQLLQERRSNLASYIGYPQTADYIKEISGVNVIVSRDPTVLADGDEMLIIRLAYRLDAPERKGQPLPEDWQFFHCTYSSQTQGA